MPRGRTLTRAERAIHFACTLGEMDLNEINEILGEAGFPELKNYKELHGAYRRYFAVDLKRVGAAIRSPPTRAELREARSKKPMQKG